MFKRLGHAETGLVTPADVRASSHTFESSAARSGCRCCRASGDVRLPPRRETPLPTTRGRAEVLDEVLYRATRYFLSIAGGRPMNVGGDTYAYRTSPAPREAPARAWRLCTGRSTRDAPPRLPKRTAAGVMRSLNRARPDPNPVFLIVSQDQAAD